MLPDRGDEAAALPWRQSGRPNHAWRHAATYASARRLTCGSARKEKKDAAIRDGDIQYSMCTFTARTDSRTGGPGTAKRRSADHLNRSRAVKWKRPGKVYSSEVASGIRPTAGALTHEYCRRSTAPSTYCRGYGAVHRHRTWPRDETLKRQRQTAIPIGSRHPSNRNSSSVHGRFASE
nr:hypothetical protein CFP56_50350 [Quercus suber]